MATNWLEVARQEFQRVPSSPTAKTAKSIVLSVLSVPGKQQKTFSQRITSNSVSFDSTSPAQTAKFLSVNPDLPFTSYWQAFYEERTYIAQHRGSMAREKAEQMAYESCVTRWQMVNLPKLADLNICLECNTPLDRHPLPILMGNEKYLWIHARCHVPLLARRRREAITALAIMKIFNPMSSL